MPPPGTLHEGLRGTVDPLPRHRDSEQCVPTTPEAMDRELHDRAEQIFEDALGKTGAKDPREFYRKRLRAMKTDNPEAYREAVAYYEKELVPSIAEDGDDPLTAWQQFGCLMADLMVTGAPVEIDSTGLERPYAPPTPADRMVLHIPQGPTGPALVVALPPELSAAQTATYDLLVGGRQKLREGGARSPENYDV